MNTTTKARDRAAELRAALDTTSSDLTAARTSLGEAIADGDDSAATEARSEVARLERFHGELSAALPVAERRAREAAQVEAQRQQKVREKAANAARKQRLAAAKKVDAALRSLGRAFDAYVSTEVGGAAGDAGRAARRARHAIAAATFHAAPGYADAIEPKRRPMRAHHEPLADAVEKTVTEFEVEGDE